MYSRRRLKKSFMVLLMVFSLCVQGMLPVRAEEAELNIQETSINTVEEGEKSEAEALEENSNGAAEHSSEEPEEENENSELPDNIEHKSDTDADSEKADNSNQEYADEIEANQSPDENEPEEKQDKDIETGNQDDKSADAAAAQENSSEPAKEAANTELASSENASLGEEKISLDALSEIITEKASTAVSELELRAVATPSNILKAQLAPEKTEVATYSAPEIKLKNILNEDVLVMLSYKTGPSETEILQELVQPSNLALFHGESVPIDRYGYAEFELLQNDDTYRNSPYYQDDFEQIKVSYTVSDEGVLNIETQEGVDNLYYDRGSNCINIKLTSKSLELDVPRLLNSDSDYDSQMGFRAHYFSFTPEEDGDYSYYSTGNSGVILSGAIFDAQGIYINGDNLDAGVNKNNFMLKDIKLKGGTKYYVGAKRQDPNTGGDYYIQISKQEEPENKELNVPEKTEGYVSLTVRKEWGDGEKISHAPVTVKILDDSGESHAELILSDSNDWSDTATGLPMYDASGSRKTYRAEEASLSGYIASYSELKTVNDKRYWVMLEGSRELEPGRDYLILAQDWGQAMYFNNPNTYYLLNDAGDEEKIGLLRIEGTNELFTGPKSGKEGMQPLTLGERSYNEWLEPEHEISLNASGSRVWRLGEQGSGFVLQNQGSKSFMLLKGDNQWWNWSNPHVYTWNISKRDGWYGNENKNYQRVLDFSDANDGMIYISATQNWGEYNPDETRYLYLNLTEWVQETAAGEQWHAGQFKFFTPIDMLEQELLVTNNPVPEEPEEPNEPDNPPVKPSEPEPDKPIAPATPSEITPPGRSGGGGGGGGGTYRSVTPRGDDPVTPSSEPGDVLGAGRALPADENPKVLGAGRISRAVATEDASVYSQLLLILMSSGAGLLELFRRKRRRSAV